MSVLRIRSWSPSRIDKYDECPAKVKYEDVLKLCPVCYKGKVRGGFNGEPVTCDSCTKEQPTREALDRGNMLDLALAKALTSDRGAIIPKKHDYNVSLPEEDQPLAVATRHPKIFALVKKLTKLKGVFIQFRITVDRQWKKLHEDPDKGVFARDAWGRLVLDVLRVTGKKAEVIDWKSGNIDKKTQEIRERSGYKTSMRLYQIGVLATHPKVTEVEARMAFTDAPPRLEEPFKLMPVLTRKELPAEQSKLTQKIEKMMGDTILAPRPGYYCSWCDFSKRKGGPCPF